MTLSCPRCNAMLGPDSVRSGENYCYFCSGAFEATTFQPPQRPAPVVTQIAVSGPDEVAACANHAGNAAVTSCQRCGLLICGLCDMNVGDGSYCPACFERVRDEGTSRMAVTRYRDYAGIARLGVILSIIGPCFAPAVAPATIWFARKGMDQRREEGRRVIGMVLAMVFSCIVFVASLAWWGFIIWSMFNTSSGASS